MQKYTLSLRSLNERLKNAFSKRNISLYNNQLHPIKKYRVYRNLISTNTISIKKEITILRN